MKISVKERLGSIFDDGKYTIIDYPEGNVDPLQFRDEKRYSDRLKETRKKTGNKDAAYIAIGHISTIKSVIFIHDFEFMGGSMGISVGNALVTASQQAIKNSAPLIAITASGGARMQEGTLSLMQMPKTILAIQMVREAHLPYITVLTNPTTGGVTASYAMLGDIQIAEPNALICFAGPRVIEQTIREKLPNGFQTSEYLLQHGMLDCVVHRKKMQKHLGTILTLLMKRRIRSTSASLSMQNNQNKT
jgi:acetyl-CoA carboxylase carboxyl transferase subunit beta